MSDLRVHDLHKTYGGVDGGVDVLRGISFDMSAGEALAVTGPSGSGKSTLLQILGTLDRPGQGTVSIGGTDPFSLDDDGLARFRNRTVGFIFQDHHLLPQYSVLENVLVPTLAFPDQVDGDAAAYARELLDKVGLGHRLDHRPAEISGGERQRVAVARSLINKPTLLLCDEPTGSLDPVTAGTVSDLLIDMHGAAGTLLIVVTHSMDLAGRFARRIELQEGRCVES
ncbi:MAG: ABC transporter ATP-binding protein [Acidobacteriota bacterium]